MNGDLRLLNRQRVKPIDKRLLRQIVHHLLTQKLKLTDFDLAIHLVNATQMARLNQLHLQHTGSTDVITLDYSEPNAVSLTGELFICIDEAILQSRHFRATWQSELLRYIIHGILHLQGHDDTSPGPRRIMKREENRLLRQSTCDFHLSKLHRKTRLKP